MIKRAFFFVIFFGMLYLLFAVAHAGQFKVTRVYDSDTFKAAGHDIEFKARLVGIDAPETKRGKRKPEQPYSQQAKKFLAMMVLNKTVDLKAFDCILVPLVL